MRVLIACEYEELNAREISGFPGYLVTDDGHVLSCRKNCGTKPYYRRLRPSIDAKGYPGLTLCGPSGERRKVRLHRLVAETFIPNPLGLPCVRHLDGNPANPSFNNLAWGSYLDNENDKRAHGTYDARRNGKLNQEHRAKIKKLARSGVSQKDLAVKYCVSRPTITRLLNQSTWSGF